jgi:preprotein translocase subunit SecE
MADWMQRVQDGTRGTKDFIEEAWVELMKVHWPTRKETYAATVVVIVVVILIALYLALVDFGLTKVIEAIIG